MASSAVKPEVMSPAGYWPQLHAAVNAGADSVYFGLKHFTARAKVGFTLEELPYALRTLHEHGVKGYLTFNTLVFEHELRQAIRAIERIVEAGADALIVQDLGVLKLAKQIAPDLELHGSTQMSITSADGVELARSLGASRVTLARELSLEEIRKIRATTDCELEIFVHGSLCVAYSGQCFSSEAWGGRSANRGQCAQACRMPYELIVDGAPEPLGDARYLLSPGDLYALRQVPEIVQIGISALKIEGRYKEADYVTLATRAYRKAVDDAWAGNALRISAQEELQLEQVYSRGLGSYFLTGTNHQEVVRGRAPRHRGVQMGRVMRVLADAVVIQPSRAQAIAPLKAGDGIVFDAADWRSPQEAEEGGRIYEVRAGADRNLELRFANGAIHFGRVRVGDLVWRTHDPSLEKTVETVGRVKQDVRVRAVAHEGQPLTAEWWLSQRPTERIVVSSSDPLVRAESRVISPQLLTQQFGRLGNTPFHLNSVELEIKGSPFAPVSVLNQLRREAVESLTALQTTARQKRVCATELPVRKARPSVEDRTPMVHLLVRTPQQLDAALDLRPASITLDYLDLYGLSPSIDQVRKAGLEVRVAAPRVLKPGEERIVEFLVRLDCPILVRSTGLLDLLHERPTRELTGDFSLNAANSLSADLLFGMRLTRLTPTHDLNAAQIAALARDVGAEGIEAIVYQHLPVFHTEHCVFCRFLSSGTSFKDCGRPCERHVVKLRDEKGRAHPVLADIGCRNTVFGAEAQEASAHLENWVSAGIRHFRLEFAHESGEEVGRVTMAFEAALSGRFSYSKLAAELKRVAPQGTTEGSLFVPADSFQLPILQ